MQHITQGLLGRLLFLRNPGKGTHIPHHACMITVDNVNCSHLLSKHTHLARMMTSMFIS